ncbi:MAG: hypothetical protein JWL77_2129 [Chthonomonadaceae bacterium]|nr:hypothetical protein [Chthonomonadaceae bacterium]
MNSDTNYVKNLNWRRHELQWMRDNLTSFLEPLKELAKPLEEAGEIQVMDHIDPYQLGIHIRKARGNQVLSLTVGDKEGKVWIAVDGHGFQVRALDDIEAYDTIMNYIVECVALMTV